MLPTDQPPYADQFDTVVDLAAAGAETSGETSVVSLLEETMADDTLVYLPAGRYQLDARVQCLEFENLGIVGPEAVIVPAAGFSDYFFDLGRPDRASGLLVEGLTFDFRAPQTGSRPLNALVADDLLVRDLDVVGAQDAGGEGLRVDVTHPEGTGVVDRLRLPDGATVPGVTGCFVGSTHRGNIRFQDCRIEGYHDNGLYADPDHGSVEVIGGYYANSNISNVRVGADSVVRNVHVRCDSAPASYTNMRGIRLTHGQDVLVDNCTVEMEQVTGSDGGIALGKSLASATVRNTEIRIDADGINAIKVKHAVDPVRADRAISFEDVTITGTAADDAAIEINERTACTVDGCTIEQDGANRDGLRFEHGAEAVIRNTRVDVTGRPLVSVDDSVVNVLGSHPPSMNTDPEEG
ncbi:right-handed parallel beta-helix repeat-containing protein [Halorarum halophilum]|uniref:Right-handed parallel beta-helix repeat-containing protein n=1 Tax=Halorarum halophilum TaxID=2743090 RepID=A0A7D5L2Q3_9EURY|nr:right-handed parallel beta-helix repeat-containing protein [Halobaculum halophilum]QLG27383.1 right-handed parallel beta-helix repeat-containing protein [Halobaculum halophilum]